MPQAEDVSGLSTNWTSAANQSDQATTDIDVSTSASSKEHDPIRKSSGLFDSVLCVVCQEVLHRATSVQPCLHSFCSSCLGEWLWSSMPGAPQCPVCREEVVRVNRNHTLDGLIDGLLQLHPERRRAEQEIKELDAQDRLAQASYKLHVLRAMHASALGLDRASELEAAARIRQATSTMRTNMVAMSRMHTNMAAMRSRAELMSAPAFMPRVGNPWVVPFAGPPPADERHMYRRYVAQAYISSGDDFDEPEVPHLAQLDED
mmetsp:Transcript_6261/g.15954  ORF Transcript_6261/g.15954 Transcript_6261/m.15954 type:complete len:261 (+) Transcript_6261:331-1113(+)